MAFTRYDGNVVPFAVDATDDNRTVFGDTTQSDDINDNLNDDFKKGWEIVGVNDNPTKQDFNGLAFTVSNLVAYLYQQGIAEWNTNQNYMINSFAMGSDGKIYQSLTDDNQGNDPTTDGDNWKTTNGDVRDVVKDDSYTAKSGEFVWCDTATNGAWTLTLPDSPNDFDKVVILDFKANFQNDNLTVARNGNTIMGLDEDYIADTKNEHTIFKFYNGDWRVM